MDLKDFPKLLVISNNCFSNVNSNGRTLGNFIEGWPKDRLAQFFVQKAVPDFSVCENYFCITDSQAMNAFLKNKAPKSEIPTEQSVPANNAPGKKNKRTSFTMLVRNMFWNSDKWKTQEFEKWVEDFAPDMILLQSGDCAFMFKIALDISKKRNIPLMVYNSEVYYFKKLDHFNCGGFSKLLYPLFRRHYRRRFEEMMDHAAVAIYACQSMKELYDTAFQSPSEVVYTATDVTAKPVSEKDGFTVSYLGNLGVGRHKSLVEIANAIHNADENAFLDVYGRIPNDEVKQAFDSCEGIRFKGFVSYDDVVRIMSESDVLVHCESFEPFYKVDSQYAFSTKIADCLANGRCFVLYAPKEMACAEYLEKENAAYVVSDKSELEGLFEKLINNPQERFRYVDKAKDLVEKNHRKDKNTQRFQSILIDTYNHRS